VKIIAADSYLSLVIYESDLHSGSIVLLEISIHQSAFYSGSPERLPDFQDI